MDQVLTQITSKHCGIGGILAAMIYQIETLKKDTPKVDSGAGAVNKGGLGNSIISTLIKLEDVSRPQTGMDAVQ